MKFPNVKSKVKFFHSILYLRKFKLSLYALEFIFQIKNAEKFIKIAKGGGFSGKTSQLKSFLDSKEIIYLQNILNEIVSEYGLKISYEEYRQQVDILSDYNYYRYKNTINPENLKRGQYLYHLHHKFTVKDGFINNISPNIISNPKNLRMLWWKDNISKGSKSEISIEELIENGQ